MNGEIREKFKWVVKNIATHILIGALAHLGNNSMQWENNANFLSFNLFYLKDNYTYLYYNI